MYCVARNAQKCGADPLPVAGPLVGLFTGAEPKADGGRPGQTPLDLVKN